MKKRLDSRIVMIAMIMLLTIAILGNIGAQKTYASDEYDAMREHRQEMLTGGSSLNGSDPDIATSIALITDEANALWTSMDVSASRTYLWSDIQAYGNSVHVRTDYERLFKMALAYSVTGSSLYGDASLAGDIVDALDYMYDSRYNETIHPTASGTSNWWDWQIGIPMPLNDTVMLMYDDLTSSQVTNYMTAVDHFSPTVTLTGANRSWKAIVVAGNGILSKDSAKLADARDGLSSIFDYVTSGDGFYSDGSFIQHGSLPYTGGYGLSLIQAVADLLEMLHGSTWEVTDPDIANVWQWVYDAYQPLIYKGAMMDMVRGREISRYYQEDHVAGHAAMESILQLAESAPAQESGDFKSMIKAWIQSDTFLDFYENASLRSVALAKNIANDSSIAPASELLTYRQYAGMDRAVQLRPGYGFGLAMYSNRILSYEAINSENGKAWYTSTGTTYLYNGDIDQYSGDYWPTVDAYRLPGTTVLSQTSTASHKSANNWTGGTDMDDLYGVSGMDLAYGSNTLQAKKSWFMFDDEIAALGAGITSTDGIDTETIIENRKLNEDGDNAFTVDGTQQASSLGWSQTLTGVNWAHLAGTASGADIGYYFPENANVEALREARTGNWKQINSRPGSPSTSITRNYLTLWMDHGTNPTADSYQYALLPGKTSSQVAAYAANPDIVTLENSDEAQAVKETSLNMIGANFWQDAAKTVDMITVNKKASVMTKEVADTSLDVSVSDPTQANSGTITVELDRSAASYTADPGITVTQLSPTIQMTVNVGGLHGQSLKASFELGVPVEEGAIILDNTDSAYVTKTGTWYSGTNNPEQFIGSNYWHDSNSGKGSKTVTYTPDIPAAGSYKVYMNWTEQFNHATNVPVTIAYDGGSDSLIVDQTADGGVWNLLGTYDFAEGTTGSVTISNTDTDNFVVADAVKFVPVPVVNPDPVIVDNADLTGVVKTGTWLVGTSRPDRYGANYWHDDQSGKGSKSVAFSANLPVSGTYNVYAMWTEYANRATHVPIDIDYEGGSDTVYVDQTDDGGEWNLLGSYTFDAASGGVVTVRNDGTTGYVIADAVKFEYVP
ncbi:polysaccharide lyase family 8 super-sandwich domain-containing protein [Paenibacillus sp. HB172176]|uniref:polysaccharide lyase family 8 super-sandwich domain-containing protein n=1 Tax=Paenibacillus sp. HB172176 TaxID=2493690 RepID=UPI00143BD3A6|nr:polysaccharide lyase family 8 super-sandwich domain-containing protein [Paenibacillus sp. HB172176]